MQSGTLDRRVVIQSATETQDASGQPIRTWSTFLSAWASRKDVRGTERHVSEQRLAVRTATYRLRWRASVNEQMRLIDDGVTWRITGIADNRRQGWMELSVEALNPADLQ